MAAVLPRPALSPQERESADLATTYDSHGINPDADTMAAILLAVQRTRQSHGIDVATTALAPQPNANGGYDVTSPLAHLYRDRSEEHTSELQSLMRISYAVFCLKKKKQKKTETYTQQITN